MENGGELKNFVLCCGALGRGSYEQFFKPMCLIDSEDSDEIKEIVNLIVKDLRK